MRTIAMVIALLVAAPGAARGSGRDEGKSRAAHGDTGSAPTSEQRPTEPRRGGMPAVGDTSAQAADTSQQMLTGVVSLVRPEQGRVLVARDASRGGAELKVTRDTDIVVDGRTGTIHDIAEGSEITARYELRETEPVALRVEVRSRGRGTAGAAARGTGGEAASGGTGAGASRELDDPARTGLEIPPKADESKETDRPARTGLEVPPEAQENQSESTER